MSNKLAVLFGGSGFIGSHFANFLLTSAEFDNVLIADIQPTVDKRFKVLVSRLRDQGKIEYQFCDVRKAIQTQLLVTESVDLIANFAAVHREPGHKPEEYYETNLLGAENVCLWSEKVKCNSLIFTSSIAPYGPTPSPKTENDIPTPTTPYGASKLVAEEIHKAWQRAGSRRKLIIARPGVVFGPGEGGNVSRLIKAIIGHYFFYMGNKETRKAGIYVKELCHALAWVLQELENRESGIELLNLTMNPSPSLQEYVSTITKVADVSRHVPSLPFRLLYILSFIIDWASKLTHVRQPINPTRMRKLINSNHIVPEYLTKHNYHYHYNLESALLDWRTQMPEEWEKG